MAAAMVGVGAGMSKRLGSLGPRTAGAHLRDVPDRTGRRRRRVSRYASQGDITASGVPSTVPGASSRTRRATIGIATINAPETIATTA